MTIVVLIVGVFFSMTFHALTPEVSKNWSSKSVSPPDEEEFIQKGPIAQSEDMSLRVSMSWRDWVTEPQFYQVSFQDFLKHNFIK